jgi:hypothetical protein
MKKIASIILLAVLTVALVGCEVSSAARARLAEFECAEGEVTRLVTKNGHSYFLCRTPDGAVRVFRLGKDSGNVYAKAELFGPLGS